MKNSDLHRIMKAKVAGVCGDDLRDAIHHIFRDRTDLIPQPARDTLELLAEENPNAFLTFIDIAAMAAQCKVRKIHRMTEPLNL